MDLIQNNTVEQENITQHYQALQELGDCYASVDDCAKAQKCYEKAASLEPDEAGPYVGLGVVALRQNLLDDAEVAFKVACRLDHDSSEAYAGLGLVAQQKEDHKHAFEMFLKCLERDTENMTALLGLFQTSCQMGSFAKVIRYLEIYLDMHPGDRAVMFSLAALYMKDGRCEQSREVLLDVLAEFAAYD